MSGRVAHGAAETVRIDLGPRGYQIVIGAGLLDEAGARIAALLPGRKVAVVTDETVARLHLPALEASLDAAGVAHSALAVPPGEASKSFAAFEDLCERLLAARIERTTVIAALGGGVVGDLAGFAAAVLLRGLDYVQLPTTLLAQVDSSVGGKTAIDTKAGKNLVGAFHQPRLVLADIAALETLPPRELKAGYAEIVKYGLINDPAFFAWCEANGAALLAGDRALRKRAVAAACRAKAAVVARDEREAGERALLNFGHTFAHALESAAGYGETLLHGEAVAAGMVMAFDLSVALGLCPAADAARLRAHFLAAGLPVGLAGLDLGGPPPGPDALLGFMARDKKVAQGRIRFVLARGIGKAFVADDVDLAAVRALLARAA